MHNVIYERSPRKKLLLGATPDEENSNLILQKKVSSLIQKS